MFELQLAEMQPPAPIAIALMSMVSEEGKTEMPGTAAITAAVFSQSPELSL